MSQKEVLWRHSGRKFAQHTCGASEQKVREARTRYEEDGGGICPDQVAELMQGFAISPEDNTYFHMKSSIRICTLNAGDEDLHHLKLVDIENLNAKQAKRIARRRVLRDRFSPMVTLPSRLTIKGGFSPA